MSSSTALSRANEQGTVPLPQRLQNLLAIGDGLSFGLRGIALRRALW
jgi:hypothetical protein